MFNSSPLKKNCSPPPLNQKSLTQQKSAYVSLLFTIPIFVIIVFLKLPHPATTSSSSDSDSDSGSGGSGSSISDCKNNYEDALDCLKNTFDAIHSRDFSTINSMKETTATANPRHCFR